MEENLHLRLRKITLVSVIIGCAIFWMGIIGAIFLHGTEEPFSILNHFVSELGWLKKSYGAPLFNQSMTIGSICFLPLILWLGLHFRTWPGILGMALGICTVLAASSLGMLPMDRIYPHMAAAMVMFVCWLSSITFFTIAFWQKRGEPGASVMVFIGCLAILSCLALLLSPNETLLTAIKAVHKGRSFLRPPIWWLAIIEWIVVLLMWLWIVLATRLILCRGDQGKPFIR